jgi:uncharacterized membrane protein
LPDKLKIQNAIVIACATAAAVGTIYANTNWLMKASSHVTTERERCYGVARAGQNDCATAKHSCAALAATDQDPNEWIMVPKGLCEKIIGGVSD